MHIFMNVMAGDQSRCALLGADEIDQEERESSGKCQPRENLAEWDWNRPSCRSMDKAVHVLPYRVSHLRAPLGKGRPRASGEDAEKTHPRGGCTVCQRGESLGTGLIRPLAISKPATRKNPHSPNRKSSPRRYHAQRSSRCGSYELCLSGCLTTGKL